jgi:hypothetical protein
MREAASEFHGARYRRNADDQAWTIRRAARGGAESALAAIGARRDGDLHPLWGLCAAVNVSQLETRQRTIACETVGWRLGSSENARSQLRARAADFVALPHGAARVELAVGWLLGTLE